MSTNASGGAGHHPSTPATCKTTTTAEQSDHAEGTSAAALLAGFVWILLGGPAAAQDRAMLRDCPLNCGCVHVFHLPAGTWRRAEPIVRAPRCAPHRRLHLEVVGVLPAVPALAGQRRRAGAA